MQPPRPAAGANARPALPATANSVGAALTAFPADAKGPHGLSPVQIEIVEFCAEAAQQLGFSLSVGQIFGVIYAAPRPLVFADVVGFLGVSNGSASQGLRLLRELGAIKLVAIAGDRREHFVAETELRRLLRRLLEARLHPPLESGARRLKTLRQLVDTTTGADATFLRQRVDSLEAWHRKALLFLPLLGSALGVPKD